MVNQFELDREKSMKLFKITKEAKKIKAITKRLLYAARKQLPKEEYKDIKGKLTAIEEGTHLILNESLKMHFKGAEPETIHQLNGTLKELADERKSLEMMIREVGA